jgi:hypothetical protein
MKSKTGRVLWYATKPTSEIMPKRTVVTTRLSLCRAGADRIAHVRLPGPCFLLCSLWLCAGLLFVGSPVQAAIKTGDILVTDQIGGTNGRGALLLVHPTTGQRTVFSDFGKPAQGPLGTGGLTSVAVGATGQIFVSDLSSGESGLGALFGVDPTTGNRTLLSDFAQGQFQGQFLYGLASSATGEVIANLHLRTRLQRRDIHMETVVGIDPATDERALITNLTNPAQGRTDSDRVLTDLALESSGEILISTMRLSDFLDSAIFRVDPVTGKRSLLSDFTNAEQGADVAALLFPGLAIETSGQILAASGGETSAPRNLLLRIDPATGQRTVLSDFDNPAQGNTGHILWAVAVEESGQIIVSAQSDNGRSLYRVEPTTGQRALFSDDTNPAQGPSFVGLTYIAVVP